MWCFPLSWSARTGPEVGNRWSALEHVFDLRGLNLTCKNVIVYLMVLGSVRLGWVEV